MFKAHRLLYHSTLGLRVIKKKKDLAVEGKVPNEDAEPRRVLVPPRCHVYLVECLGFRV